MTNFDLIKCQNTYEEMATLLVKNFYQNLPMHQEVIKQVLIEWLETEVEQ